MAYYDAQRGEIVLRILYDGLATAGKTSTLRALHTAFPHHVEGNVYVPQETSTGRTLFFDWLDLRVGHMDEWPLRCQVLTAPGQFALAERRFRLLQELDAAVLVSESTANGVRAALMAWRFLARVMDASGNTNAPIIIQANKQDLPNALTCDEIRNLLAAERPSEFPLSSPGIRRRIVDAPVLPTSAISGEGIRLPFIAALDQVRQRLRPILREQGVGALRPLARSAREVY
jgi:hypothetical protein